MALISTQEAEFHFKQELLEFLRLRLHQAFSWFSLRSWMRHHFIATVFVVFNEKLPPAWFSFSQIGLQIAANVQKSQQRCDTAAVISDVCVMMLG